MLSFIVRRFLYMIPTLIIVSLVSFAIIQLMPGNFTTAFKLNPRFSKETIATLEARYGLDKPWYVRYWKWITGIITRGDFGYSMETSQPAFDALFRGRLSWTLMMSFGTLVFTWVLAIPIGIYSAIRQYSVGDYVLTFFGFLGLSIPNFFLALVIIWLLVAVLNVGALGLGVGGLFDVQYINAPWSWGKFVNFMWHLWPIIVVVGTSNMASLIRYMRGQLLDTLGQQYVLTARAKGLSERVVIWKHAVRNAINPLITMLGMSLPTLFEGAFFTAIILGVPSVERAFWNALQRQDEYVVMSGLLFFAFLLMVGNLLGDLMLAWVDPRIRYD
ncbi:MAG: Peptide/nickel transport system permease protein [Acetothermia bacterium 64_32]|nr:MAG: Peptide/nickel transport system permease protein [Acetothermia bacterium 64_32]